jgi:hypothetical protein
MSMMDPIGTASAFDIADRRWGELKSERSWHEQLWEDIARLMRPQRGGFSRDDPGGRTHEKPLSSAPIMAQSNFAAGLYGTLTNPANRWFGFTTNDPDRNAWHEGKLWLDKVTDRVLASFMPSVSPFYSASTQIFADIASFGNGAQYDELVPEERRILDVTLNLGEVCYDIDGFGRICEVVRRFHLKPAAALRMFGQKALPAKLYDMAQKGDQANLVFFQHVHRNDGFQPGRLGPKGKRWISRYSCEVERAEVRQGGYDEMPFFAPRWEVETGQVYGVGPGFVALASARSHNRMDEATLRAARWGADPTMLAPDRSWELSGQIRPGKVVYGAIDTAGRQMLKPLDISGNIGLTLEEKQAKLEEIKDAFHYSLMNLAGRTGMTATEVATITEERQRLWAPHQGRIQEEYLARKIERRFSILWRAGQLPPAPKGMEGAALEVKYESAAAAAQKATEGTATMRVLQDVAPLIEFMPRIAERFDPDGLIEVLMDARGAPARIVRSRDEADAIAEQRQQAEQAMMAMQAAQAGAGALKDGAQAMAAMQPQGGGM